MKLRPDESSPSRYGSITRREFVALSTAAAAGYWRAGPASADLASTEAICTRRGSTPEAPIRERLAQDPQRPQYHLLPPANWMSDPNGPIVWKGQYHMFYQYNPKGAFWGNMHWGHATSPDAVHWKHLPVALAPTSGGPDKDGCFSGCAVVNRGVPTLVYTGVWPEVQCLSTGDDSMLTWKKHPGNPVVAAPPKDLEVTGFRDPCVWKERDGWYMAIGSGIKGAGGLVLLYRSKDMTRWEYLHPLCAGSKVQISDGNDPVATGEMWECPDFFPLGSKHVLLVSTRGSVFYSVGAYSRHTFRPEMQGNADLGGEYYAARSMVDDRGRRILWGWIREGRSEAAHRSAAWAGVMSLPRLLSLAEDNSLRFEPVPELEVLRGRHFHLDDWMVTPQSQPPLHDASGDALEIAAEFESHNADEFGLKVRCAPDKSEFTLISYDRAARQLRLDRQRASLSADASKGVQAGPFDLAPQEALKLRIFLDGSVVEVFANGRACLTSRIYPTQMESLGLGIFARGGKAKIRSLDAWVMQPISKDRLTS
jgi:beta-fructofuranosidase